MRVYSGQTIAVVDNNARAVSALLIIAGNDLSVCGGIYFRTLNNAVINSLMFMHSVRRLGIVLLGYLRVRRAWLYQNFFSRVHAIVVTARTIVTTGSIGATDL